MPAIIIIILPSSLVSVGKQTKVLAKVRTKDRGQKLVGGISLLKILLKYRLNSS